MTRDHADYLADMLAYALKARDFVGAMTVDELLADERTFLATIRALEIIGEAARHVPADFRDRFPDIPWKRIVAMRNILIHNYEGADPGIVHYTVVTELVALIAALPEAVKAAEAE